MSDRSSARAGGSSHGRNDAESAVGEPVPASEPEAQGVTLLVDPAFKSPDFGGWEPAKPSTPLRAAQARALGRDRQPPARVSAPARRADVEEPAPESASATSGPMPIVGLSAEPSRPGRDTGLGNAAWLPVKRLRTIIGLQDPKVAAVLTGPPPDTEAGDDSLQGTGTPLASSAPSASDAPAATNSEAVVVARTRPVDAPSAARTSGITKVTQGYLLPPGPDSWGPPSEPPLDTADYGNLPHSRVVAQSGEIDTASGRRRPTMVDEPSSTRAEAFRILCHRLRAAEDWRWIAVTAPRDGDEAAVCGAELALAYAQATSRRVLLLEVDVQKPRLAQVLGLSVTHCFAEQLHRKYEGSREPWRAATVHCDNLHVMAVHPSMSAVERIRPHIFHDAVSDLLQSRYDHVVVVCPRVLDSANVTLITGFVQGAVLTGQVGMKGVELKRAAQQLLPTKVLAVALLDGL